MDPTEKKLVFRCKQSIGEEKTATNKQITKSIVYWMLKNCLFQHLTSICMFNFQCSMFTVQMFLVFVFCCQDLFLRMIIMIFARTTVKTTHNNKPIIVIRGLTSPKNPFQFVQLLHQRTNFFFPFFVAYNSNSLFHFSLCSAVIFHRKQPSLKIY